MKHNKWWPVVLLVMFWGISFEKTCSAVSIESGSLNVGDESVALERCGSSDSAPAINMKRIVLESTRHDIAQLVESSGEPEQILGYLQANTYFCPETIEAASRYIGCSRVNWQVAALRYLESADWSPDAAQLRVLMETGTDGNTDASVKLIIFRLVADCAKKDDANAIVRDWLAATVLTSSDSREGMMHALLEARLYGVFKVDELLLLVLEDAEERPDSGIFELYARMAAGLQSSSGSREFFQLVADSGLLDKIALSFGKSGVSDGVPLLREYVAEVLLNALIVRDCRESSLFYDAHAHLIYELYRTNKDKARQWMSTYIKCIINDKCIMSGASSAYSGLQSLGAIRRMDPAMIDEAFAGLATYIQKETDPKMAPLKQSFEDFEAYYLRRPATEQ